MKLILFISVLFVFTITNQKIADSLSQESLSVKQIGSGYDTRDNYSNYLNQGFQLACVGIGDCTTLIEQGYKPENIRMSVNMSNWHSDINAAINLGVREFFIDEPIRQHTEDTVRAIANYTKDMNVILTLSESEFMPTILFKFGYKGNIGQLVCLAKSLPVMPQLSCHSHWDSGWWSFRLFSAYIFYVDPRVHFRWLKENYPDNFDCVWIGYDETEEQKQLIFEELVKLQVNHILIFPYFDGQLKYDSVGMEINAELAKQYGWI